jgi:hypothetical protein
MAMGIINHETHEIHEKLAVDLTDERWRGGQDHAGVRPSSGAATSFIQTTKCFQTALH